MQQHEVIPTLYIMRVITDFSESNVSTICFPSGTLMSEIKVYATILTWLTS